MLPIAQQRIPFRTIPLVVRFTEPGSGTTACNIHITFIDGAPQHIHGYFQSPPGKEGVERAIEEWHGFRVELGPWEKIERGEQARPEWTAQVSACQLAP